MINNLNTIHTVVLFEDRGVMRFGPIADLRPAWLLRTGAMTGIERARLLWPGCDVYGVGRTALKACYASNWIPHDLKVQGVLFINGLAIPDVNYLSELKLNRPAIWMKGDRVAAFIIDDAAERPFDADGLLDESAMTDLPRQIWRDGFAAAPWTVMEKLTLQITADLELLRSRREATWFHPPDDAVVRNVGSVETGGEATLGPGVILNAENYFIRLEDGVEIGAGAVLDSTNGPIWLERDGRVEIGAIVQGPAFIGAHSIIRPGARLSGGVALGLHCRVGGEISNIVAQGYVNKQHSGYLGTCCLGEWINLGAATDNSDLKNNYQPVTVSIRGERVNTGLTHFGAIIGDFTRTAIHTRLNTGAVIGICCNIFTPDFPPGEIPAFTWLGADGGAEYKLDKALDTIGIVMSRRGQNLDEPLKDLLTRHFYLTADDRKRMMIRQ